MTEKILYEKRENGIAIITFNRPELHNALDIESMRRFAQLVHDLQDDDRVRVVILAGAGENAFCSGGDLFELSTLTTEDDARMFITIMGDALRNLEQLPVPVIAAINGYALGGGSEIAVACDMRIVDDHVRMGFIQIRLALTPGWGAGQRLLKLVGYPKAMDLLLHGHVMRAAELAALGLANKVVDKGMALEYALNFARQIAQQPPDAVRGVKALLRAGLEKPYAQALHVERDLFPPLWAAEAHTAAVADFLRRNSEKVDS